MLTENKRPKNNNNFFIAYILVKVQFSIQKLR